MLEVPRADQLEGAVGLTTAVYLDDLPNRTDEGSGRAVALARELFSDLEWYLLRAVEQEEAR